MFLRKFINSFNKSNISEGVLSEESFDPQVEKISSASIIDIKDLRIKALEHQIELLNERLLHDNKKIPTTNRKHAKIVDVISDLFYLGGEELNADQVLERMDKKKLKNKKPDIRSVRATLYYLKGIEALQFGKKKGTFRYNIVRSKII